MAKDIAADERGARVDAVRCSGTTRAREEITGHVSAKASQGGKVGNATRVVLRSEEPGEPTVPDAGDPRQRALQVARRMRYRTQDRGGEGTGADQWPEGWEAKERTEAVMLKETSVRGERRAKTETMTPDRT